LLQEPYLCKIGENPYNSFMSETFSFRYAEKSDLPAITEIYNYYIINSAVVFELEPVSLENRELWFSKFDPASRYKVIAACFGSKVAGYASSSRFREKTGYAPSVETSIFVHPDYTGRSAGSGLYSLLFSELSSCADPVHRAYACLAVPNPSSAALHERFGFRKAGYFTEAGYKFGKYHDIQWWEKSFSDTDKKTDKT
jgi:phosphinothricin acetyltransferase